MGWLNLLSIYLNYLNCTLTLNYLKYTMYTYECQVHLVPILETYEMKMKNGYIYFAEFVWSGLVKIGWTGNVRNRMRALETDFKEPVELLAYVPGDVSHELDLHRSLSRHAIEEYTSKRKGRHCEIYFPEKELIDFIDGLDTNYENVRKINAWLNRPYKVRRGSLSRSDVVKIRMGYVEGLNFDKLRHEYRVGIYALIKILSGRTYRNYPGPTFEQQGIIKANNIIFPS